MSETATAAPDSTDWTGRRWPTIVALATLTAVLTVVAGPTGTIAGLATGLTWYGLGTPYAIAAGHVSLAAAFPNGIDPGAFLFVELAFGAVLLAAVVRPATWPVDAGIVLTSATGFVGGIWLVSWSQSLWLGAGVLLSGVALTAYILHRYELVRLGLVPDDHNSDSNTDLDSSTHEQ